MLVRYNVDCEELRDNEGYGVVGGENKRQKAAGGLEPAEVRREHGVVWRQERSCDALPLTQSSYSIPTLVPHFMIECPPAESQRSSALPSSDIPLTGIATRIQVMGLKIPTHT